MVFNRKEYQILKYELTDIESIFFQLRIKKQIVNFIYAYKSPSKDNNDFLQKIDSLRFQLDNEEPHSARFPLFNTAASTRTAGEEEEEGVEDSRDQETEDYCPPYIIVGHVSEDGIDPASENARYSSRSLAEEIGVPRLSSAISAAQSQARQTGFFTYLASRFVGRKI